MSNSRAAAIQTRIRSTSGVLRHEAETFVGAPRKKLWREPDRVVVQVLFPPSGDARHRQPIDARTDEGARDDDEQRRSGVPLDPALAPDDALGAIVEQLEAVAVEDAIVPQYGCEQVRIPGRRDRNRVAAAEAARAAVRVKRLSVRGEH